MSETTKETCNTMRRLLEATQLAATDCSTIVVTIAVRTLWPFIHDAEELRRVEENPAPQPMSVERERDEAIRRGQEKDERIAELEVANERRRALLEVRRKQCEGLEERIAELEPWNCPRHRKAALEKIAALEKRIAELEATLEDNRSWTCSFHQSKFDAKDERIAELEKELRKKERLIQAAHASAAARLDLKDERIAELEAAMQGLLMSADCTWEERSEGHDWAEACEGARALLGEGGDDDQG